VTRVLRKNEVLGDIASDDSGGRAWEDVGARWVEAEPQRLWRMHADRVASELALRWIPPGSGRVLKTDLFDEAVGAGCYRALAERARSVSGIDVAPSVVAAAGARYPELSVGLADVRRLPFEDAAFDVVFSPSTLDHFGCVGDIEVALREIRRVLPPGGRLVVTLDNPLNPIVGLRQALPGGLLRRLGLVPYFCGATVRPGRLRRMTETAGFAIRDHAFTIHCPRVMAVAAAGLIERRFGGSDGRAAGRLLSLLAGLEGLRRFPTAPITGHFSAFCAEAL
jgi:SAM-dependent methyltransferase